ncbi:MAG: MBL fold metallo-hydrolase [Gammaproteobacteria bacterium]|nr:MBL fold metallo-hydrolase [Gammaproteobacteria bacterium]
MIRLLFLSLFLILSACSSSEPKSCKNCPAHHANNGYTNPYIKPPAKNFFSFIKMKFFGDDIWIKPETEAHLVPIAKLDTKLLHQKQAKPRVTWLGHSTFLLQYNNKTLMTDPIFSDRASPFSFIGPKRYVPHAMDYSNLPAIDAVIISHNHYDHLDIKSIQLIGNQAQYFVPLGIKQWLVEIGIDSKQIIEMDWWQKSNLSDGFKFTSTPSQHWSARSLTDRYKSLWSSWFIKMDDWTIWFAGDTGYNKIQFKEIGQRFDIDLALIPIGAYAPRWFMRYYHVNPEEAITIHHEVGARQSIGMHWGTFPLTAEAPLEPVRNLSKAKSKYQLKENEFSTMAIGESRVLSP